jgi:hypothetical protein
VTLPPSTPAHSPNRGLRSGLAFNHDGQAHLSCKDLLSSTRYPPGAWAPLFECADRARGAWATLVVAADSLKSAWAALARALARSACEASTGNSVACFRRLSGYVDSTGSRYTRFVNDFIADEAPDPLLKRRRA